MPYPPIHVDHDRLVISRHVARPRLLPEVTLVILDIGPRWGRSVVHLSHGFDDDMV